MEKTQILKGGHFIGGGENSGEEKAEKMAGGDFSGCRRVTVLRIQYLGIKKKKITGDI